jgi:hypothetical protein
VNREDCEKLAAELEWADAAPGRVALVSMSDIAAALRATLEREAQLMGAANAVELAEREARDAALEEAAIAAESWRHDAITHLGAPPGVAASIRARKSRQP